MADSLYLSQKTASQLATILAYLVQREGMIVLPEESEIRDAVKCTELSIVVDKDHNKVVLTLVPKVEP